MTYIFFAEEIEEEKGTRSCFVVVMLGKIVILSLTRAIVLNKIRMFIKLSKAKRQVIKIGYHTILISNYSLNH